MFRNIGLLCHKLFTALLGGLLLLCPLFSTAAGFNTPERISAFIENKGQLNDMDGVPAKGVLYYYSGTEIDVFVTAKGLTYLFKAAEKQKSGETEETTPQIKSTTYRWERADMELPGAVISRENLIGLEAVSSKMRFFVPSHPGGIAVDQHKRIIFKNIYPGIDWVLYTGKTSGLKHEFFVRAGADPAKVKMVYRSLHPVKKSVAGDLVLETTCGTLTEEKPELFILPGNRKIAGTFQVAAPKKNTEGFETAITFNYQHQVAKTDTLVLDPVLVWSTFFGGTLHDWITAVRSDTSGNVFTCGYTQKTAFPLLNGGAYFQGTTTSLPCAFICKFGPQRDLQWSTFYAGSVREAALHMEIDQGGNLNIAGMTMSQDLPLQNAGGWFQPVYAGNTDLFVLRFDNMGNRLYCSYFGGSGNDWPWSLDLDKNENLLVAGITLNGGLPLQDAGGYFQSTISNSNGFILRFDPATNLTWSTYFGSQVESISLATDQLNNIYLCGQVRFNGNIPLLQGYASGYQQSAKCGLTEGFIAQFSSNTMQTHGTYFGGCEMDKCHSLVCDMAGNIFVSGITKSADFPLLDNGGFYYQGTRSSQLPADAFILKFDAGFQLGWSTCIGGSGEENMYGYENMTLNKCDELFLMFETTSELASKQSCEGGHIDGVRHDGTFLAGQYDLFITRFSNNGQLQYGSYFGGKGWNVGTSLHVNKNDQMYVTGIWVPQSVNVPYPVMNPGGNAYFDAAWSGEDDSFIAEFASTGTMLAQHFTYPSPICIGGKDVPPVLGPGFAAGGTFSSSSGLGIHAQSGSVTLNGTVPGTYTVTYSGGQCGCSPTVSSSATIEVAPPFNIDIADTTLCEGNTIQIIDPEQRPQTSYLWLPGNVSSPTLQASPKTKTEYTVRAKWEQCTDSANFTIFVNQRDSAKVLFSYPSPVCINAAYAEPILQSAFSQGGKFYSDQSLDLDSASGIIRMGTLPVGNYTVNYEIPYGDCHYAGSSYTRIVVTDNIKVDIEPAPRIIEGQSVRLTANGGSSYEWTPAEELNCGDCRQPVASPTVTTEYCVLARRNNCTGRACVVIDVICNNGGDFSAPNAFTPNNDQLNDLFCLQGWTKCVLEFSVKIYDRWGGLVFESDDPEFCWDGSKNGTLLADGVYTYAIVARYEKEGVLRKGGNITLMR